MAEGNQEQDNKQSSPTTGSSGDNLKASLHNKVNQVIKDPSVVKATGFIKQNLQDVIGLALMGIGLITTAFSSGWGEVFVAGGLTVSFYSRIKLMVSSLKDRFVKSGVCKSVMFFGLIFLLFFKLTYFMTAMTVFSVVAYFLPDWDEKNKTWNK